MQNTTLELEPPVLDLEDSLKKDKMAFLLLYNSKRQQKFEDLLIFSLEKFN